MGVLDRFEKGIERAVNGAFAKAFRSEVQPVEIASALRRECDDKSAVIGRDRTIAPNAFVVELGSADHQRLGQWADALGRELSAVLTDHARQQRYSFVGPVSVTFAEADDLDTGVFRVQGATAPAGHAGHADPSPQDDPSVPADQSGSGRPGVPALRPPDRPPASAGVGAAPPAMGAAPPAMGAAPPAMGAAPPAMGAAAPALGAPPAGMGAAPPGVGAAPPEPGRPGRSGPPGAGRPEPGPTAPSAAVLEVDGQPYRVARPVVVIGRGTEADIMLDDAGVSRRHAEVHSVDGRVRIIDLGSTNGTFVDGEKVPVATLRDGSVVTIGRTRIVFRAPGAGQAPEAGQAPGAR